MKKLFFLLAALMLLVPGCDRKPAGASPPSQVVDISFSYTHRDGIASNQFAVWIEDESGKLVKTLFVTRFTAKGGWKQRPEAIPLWVEKTGIAGGGTDAHSGATPKSGQLSYIWDCTDESGQPVPDGEYRYIVEGTIFWQDAVTYTGTITVGGDETTASAEATYTTEEAGQKEMITNVTAAVKRVNIEL